MRDAAGLRGGLPGRLAGFSAGPGLRLWAAFAAIYLIWGSTYLAIRIALESLPPFAMAGARFVVAGAMLVGWARLRGNPWPRWPEWRAAAIAGALLFLAGNGGLAWAEQRVASGVAALLIATVPLWMAVVSGVRSGGGPTKWVGPGRRAALGLALGFAGVALLVLPAGDADRGVDPIGAAVLIAAALAWVAGSLFGREAVRPRSVKMASGMAMLAGGALLLAAALATGESGRIEWADISLRSLLAVAYLVVFGSVVAFTAYAWLLAVAPPTRVASYAYVNPIVAVFLGWGLADEPLTPALAVAAGVIVIAVALVVTARAPAAAPGAGASNGAAGPEPAYERRLEVIARLWQGTTQAAHGDRYQSYLEETGLRDYRATPGNRGAWILRRDTGDRVEFLVVSMWESWDAIRRFAGPDVDRAVYYPRDREFLLELTPTVDHYEVVDPASEAPSKGVAHGGPSA